MAYDIVITSGIIIDGSGKPPVEGDVGINGEEVVAIGKLGKARAEVTINASGKFVVPGFIDITNHSDTHVTLFTQPGLESLVMQGITTIIGGNCGASLAPLASHEAINAIRKWADPADINVNWEDMEDYLSVVEKLKPAVNYGTFVGYGTVRRGVIGKEARVLEAQELESVRLLVAEGMAHGAFGLSLGLSYGHERVSPVEEIIEVAKILDRHGVLKVHLRSEGRELLASINEAIQIGREADVSVEISHLKAVGKGAWPSFRHGLELIRNARASGLDIHYDISPYHTTGSPLYLLVPAWARQGGFAELFTRMDNPEERKKIIAQIDAYSFHYDKIVVISAEVDTIIGKTLSEIASYSNMSPAETLLEVIRANEGRVSTVGHTVSRKNTELGIIEKDAIIASDGAGFSQDAFHSGNLVHPRSFGAFPHFWHKFVNDERSILAEEAVRKITSLPAAKLGLVGRGLIAKGSFADIVVFDPRLMRDRATYDNPFRYSAGIDWVVINGTVVVEGGRHLGVRPGKVLRKA